MDDALIVRCLQGLGDLPRQFQRLLNRDWTFREPVGEVFPFDELHGQEEPTPDLLQAVHRGDAGVVQRGQKLGLALEARQALGIFGELLG